MEAITAFVANELLNEETYTVSNHLKDCDFCSDAIEGIKLSEQPIKNISEIKKGLNIKYGNSTESKQTDKRKKLYIYSSIAASIALIIGLFFLIKPSNENQFTENIIINNKRTDTTIQPPNPLSNNNIYSDKNTSSSYSNIHNKKIFSQHSTEPANNFKDEIFEFTDEMPEFPNGIVALDKAISKRIKDAKKTYKVQSCSKILVEFIIDENGKVTNPAVVNKKKTKLDIIAIEVIKNLPLWKPGRQSGQPVKVLYTLPVSFDSC